MIHRYALASKTLPDTLKQVLDSVIKIFYFVKGSALQSRLFRHFCHEMGADHESLIYHTQVRWLSKGNVLQRVVELKEEIKLFLQVQGKQELRSNFDDERWCGSLAYLADIFEQLNIVNLKMQGPETNILKFKDILTSFIEKLDNWIRKA